MNERTPPMKKAAALLFSVLFYIGAFALAFICASEQNLLYFACILPPIVALYFVIAGNIFAHRLWLNRWLLWFVLNFAGGICSWGLLIPLRTMPPVGINETIPPKPCMWFIIRLRMARAVNGNWKPATTKIMQIRFLPKGKA